MKELNTIIKDNLYQARFLLKMYVVLEFTDTKAVVRIFLK